MSTLTLPRAIQRQMAEAEALMNPPAPQDTVDPPAPQDTEVQPRTEPTAPPQDQTQQVQSPPVQTDTTDDVWKRRFESLDGKYRNEVPQLNHLLRQTQSENDQLKQRLDEFSRKLEELSTRPQDPPKPAITHKDAEVFGADLVEMVQRVASESLRQAAEPFSSKFAEMAGRIEQLEQRITGTSRTVQASAQDVFLSRLESKVPNWQQLDKDPQFLGWLGEVDPVYGVPRQAGLDSAVSALDADRAANVFNAYLRSIAPPAASSPSKDLERQVAPSSSSAPSAPASNGPRRFSIAEVEKFYTELRRGMWRGREADAARFEAEINAAIASGNVG